MGRDALIAESGTVREKLAHAGSYEKDQGADFDPMPRSFDQGDEHSGKLNSHRDQRFREPGNPSS